VSRVGKTADIFDLLVRYIKQETVAPLRGAGRWLAFGVLASLAIVLGAFFFLLAVLRILQGSAFPFNGGWSWVPYFLTALITLSFVIVSLSRIKRPQLNRSDSGA